MSAADSSAPGSFCAAYTLPDEMNVQCAARAARSAAAARAKPGWRVTSITASHSRAATSSYAPGCDAVGAHELGAVGYRAGLAAGEAGHPMPARQRLRREGASEPLRAAEDEQVHLAITARHRCRRATCSRSANPRERRVSGREQNRRVAEL